MLTTQSNLHPHTQTSLGDMLKVDWLKPSKSDKGSIILHLNGRFNLHLWTKDNLDDWMFMIKESIIRYHTRRSCLTQNSRATILACLNLQKITSNGDAKFEISPDDLYENTGANLQKSTDAANIAVAGSENSDFRSQHNSNSNLPASKRENCPKPRERASKLAPSTKQTSPSGLSERQEEEEKSLPRVSGVNRAQLESDRLVINGLAETDDASNDCTKSVNQEETPGPQQLGQIINNREDISSNCGGTNDEFRHNQALNDLSNASSIHSDQMSSTSMEQSRSLSRKRKDSARNKTAEIVTISTKSGSADRKQQRRSSLVDELPEQQRSTDLKSPETENVCKLDVTSDGNRTNQSTTADGCTAANENSSSNFCSDNCNDVDRATPPLADTNQVQAESIRHALGPTTSLIRRDDSWQSLVSLTRVGRAPTAMQVDTTDNIQRSNHEPTPPTECLKRLTIPMAPMNALAVAQRSLYAQHIMPHSVDAIRGNNGGLLAAAGGPPATGSGSLVESTVTPVRAGPFRQHSIQSYSSHKRQLSSQASQALANHRAGNSFDVSSSRQQQPPRTPVSVSYQQKLLQLQLMHNSNNVDYIRQQNNGLMNGANNDYQIYGPESTVYGYSSMRSNLKSAASEFSFIRPNTSSHIQSTLPHQNSAHVLVDQAAFISNETQQQLDGVFARSPSFRTQQSAIHRHQLRDTNNNLIESEVQQFLVDPNTGKRLPAHLLQQQSSLAVELIPPKRELPLKPNKKRSKGDETSSSNNAKSLPKSSSLTSSIACFFRRAFSRRSKKRSKQRSKLTESCSSSMGAFENENFVGIPIVPSAFSTGSKSVDGRHMSDHSNQPQRMVDMIQAFTSKNFTNQTNYFDQRTTPTIQIKETLTGQVRESLIDTNGNIDGRIQNCSTPNQLTTINKTDQQPTVDVTPARLRGISQARMNVINQFVASPLHKSNSISATMGLSSINNSAVGKRAGFIKYDNELRALHHVGGGGSPVLPRSSKVLSANLTPLRDPMNQNQHHHHRLSVLPPNNGARMGEYHQMPRPSSIYGQPSMIASGSPVMSRSGEERNANFGLQRNSVHGYNIKSKVQAPSSVVGGELLRAQMMQANHLCTTQEEEAAEELPSIQPICEPKSTMIISNSELSGHYDNRSHIIAGIGSNSGHYVSRTEAINMISASPRNANRHTPQHRSAVVNPILQSPTMDTIYDNHPMMLNGRTGRGGSAHQSHYDNHNQQLARLAQQQSPMVRRAKASDLMTQIYPNGHSESCPLIESPYSSNRMVVGHLEAPSHRRAGLFLSASNKPAAIVAPSSTANRLGGVTYNSCNGNSADHLDHQLELASRDQLAFAENGSPLIHRRNVRYQQSSLIDRDKPRTNPIYSTGNASGQQSLAVNIAGAPGINLDPALAASLLRGTNIDAYESCTYNNYPAGGQSYGGNTNKTFLVSTRLSKSMAHHQLSSQSNTDGSSSLHKASDKTFRRPSGRDDELSSPAGPQSINSTSLVHSPTKVDYLNHHELPNSIGPCDGSKEEEDQLNGDSSSGESNRGGYKRAAVRKNSSTESSCNTGDRSGGGSETSKRWDSEQSDVAESLASKSLEGERNWITSKLIGRQQQ